MPITRGVDTTHVTLIAVITLRMPEAACTSLSRSPKLAGKVPEIQDLLLANCVWPNDSSSLWDLSFAAAADFADWPGLCAYLAHFRILLITFEGSYASLTRVDPLERSYIGKSSL